MCTKVDGIGIAAKTLQQLIKNLQAVFQYLRIVELQLSWKKYCFDVQEIDILARAKTTKGVAPQKHKFAKVLKKINFPLSKSELQRYSGLLNYYRNSIGLHSD